MFESIFKMLFDFIFLTEKNYCYIVISRDE